MRIEWTRHYCRLTICSAVTQTSEDTCRRSHTSALSRVVLPPTDQLQSSSVAFPLLRQSNLFQQGDEIPSTIYDPQQPTVWGARRQVEAAEETMVESLFNLSVSFQKYYKSSLFLNKSPRLHAPGWLVHLSHMDRCQIPNSCRSD